MSESMKGTASLIRKMNKIAGAGIAKSTLQAAADNIKDEIKIYPPVSEANNPANKRYYERGYGPKWRLKSGKVHGRKTSRNLGEKWATKVTGLRAIIGNKVPYGIYVQSKESQARIHKIRGWRTDADIVKIMREPTLKLFRDVIKKAMNEKA
jgi:phage gpG-like protein